MPVPSFSLKSNPNGALTHLSGENLLCQTMLPTITSQHRAARIALRDPARRNALDAATLELLRAHLRSVRDDPEIDALVLEGEGAAFCSGFDLAACVESPRLVEDLLRGLSDCVAELRALDVPVVARVQGAALAGGCALLTGCDFVVVATDAQLGYPTHRIGISPAVSLPTLSSRMGPAARALALSNDLIDGRTALARGLATHCVEPDRLDAEVDQLVARLLAKGPLAMRATKRWIRDIEERGGGDLGPSQPRDRMAMESARDASIGLASGDEFATMLRAFWAARSQAR